MDNVAESLSWAQRAKGAECQYWSFIHKNSVLHSAARGIFLKGETDHVIPRLYTLQKLPFALRIQLRTLLDGLQGPAFLSPCISAILPFPTAPAPFLQLC